MISIFYLISILFIWSETYLVFNKARLDSNYLKKDITSFNNKDIIYYFLRLVFFIWLVVGLWSSYPLYFLGILILNLLKFPLYHISKMGFAIYDNVLPSVNIFCMVVILANKFLF